MTEVGWQRFENRGQSTEKRIYFILMSVICHLSSVICLPSEARRAKAGHLSSVFCHLSSVKYYT